MEKRYCKLSVRNCGGNASKGSKQFTLALPTKWVQALGLTPEERDVEITQSGSRIIIRKRKESEKVEA